MTGARQKLDLVCSVEHGESLFLEREKNRQEVAVKEGRLSMALCSADGYEAATKYFLKKFGA